MTFKEAINIIVKTLSQAGTAINADNYDGVIIKKLAASNTLDAGRTTNQTHIAITGAQMDIFPYLCAGKNYRLIKILRMKFILIK